MAPSSKTANAVDTDTTTPADEAPSAALDYSNWSNDQLVEFRDLLTETRELAIQNFRSLGAVLASVETEIAIRPKGA